MRKFYFELNTFFILLTADLISTSDAAYEILMQFGFPKASPVTVATCAFSSRNSAKSLAFSILFPLILFPKYEDMSGKT